MPYSIRLIFITLFGSLLVVPLCNAEQYYQTEIIGGYEKEDADTSTGKTISFGFQYYFAPVNTNSSPLSEAAFLDKKGSIVAGYINSKSDLQNSTVDSIDSSGPLIAINYITETDAFILGAIYSKLDGDINPSLATIDATIVGFTIGKYINNSTSLEASYSRVEADYMNTSSSQIFELNIDYYELTYKTVQELGDDNFYSFNIGYTLTNKDDSTSTKEDNNEVIVSGGYYFSRMTSLDLSASFNSGDDVSDEGQTLGIGFTHFIAPQIALEIEMSKFSADDNNTEDLDSISFDVIARF